MKRLSLSLVFVLSACGGSGSSNTPNALQPEVTPVSRAENPCNRSSWTAGTVEYCRGELVYRDYIYDDYGADAGLIALSPSVLNVTTRAGIRGNPFATTPGLLSPTAGDVTYPADKRNTADLVRLSLREDNGQLRIEAELNTVFAANDALVAVAIDTDNDASTGGGAWSPLSVRSAGWDTLIVLDTANPETNVLTTSMPMPAGSTWRLQAAVAQANGTVMNVAFRGIDEQAKANGSVDQLLPGSGNFWEDKQAAALASGDISAFGELVNTADLRNRITRAAPLPEGFHQRVYTSAYTVGEGINFAGEPNRSDNTSGFCSQSFAYLGKYQPYGIYVPPLADGETLRGAQLVMHGCEANHASQINQRNMQLRFGDARQRILVSPLGRGPYGFYSGLAERDVLDALADVEAHYEVDADRVVSSGYSMGGFGAMHMAAMYPDRFSGVVNWVGATGALTNIPSITPELDALLDTLLQDVVSPLLMPIVGDALSGAKGYENVINYLGNLRHVPSANLYSALDELVQVNQAIALAKTMMNEGIPYRFYLHPVSEHLTFLLLDDWQKESQASADWVLEKNPLQVTYQFDPRFDYPEYELVHDRAYWLSGLRSRDGMEAEIDLRGTGCGGSEPILVEGTDLGPAPTPWVSTNRVETGRNTVAPESLLSGSLRNVSAASIDSDRICSRGESLRYDIVSDGPATLTFSDGRVLSLVAGQNSGQF
ncbi:prolyl oligopeptidase family protein [Paraperlucidibaca baekdonensis]|uniref:Prolyl oligopeptidase family protein n=1 Tax=Paraperlucidibaca baekdonensis TaxID=748120 RepID=A0A3E0H939_9GAMM|nr:prolyl oligopeptidase family serine peptidase [Paraperlucidibaca baekdonensis]REH40226.1 prolyl oligopeptidase family protein [Paraperlucidibaca baekdonensis]